MIDILSEDEIVAVSLPFRRSMLCGLYFLIKHDEVVYIGKSKVLFSRVSTHVTNKIIDFDRIAFVFCSETELAVLETAYIQALEPIHNRINNRDTLRKQAVITQPMDIDFKRGDRVIALKDAVQYISDNWFPISKTSLLRRAQTDGDLHLGRFLGSRIIFERGNLEAWAKRQMENGTIKPAPKKRNRAQR